MLKIWILYNLFITVIVFGTSITGVKDVAQFLLPLFLLPILYYLGKELLKKPRRHKLQESFSSTIPVGVDNHVNPSIAEEGVALTPGVSDDNRRIFLKLLGTTGLSLVFMAVLGKKSAQAAFFGSVPGPGAVTIKDSTGVAIDPAEKQSTDGYEISEVDDSGTISYYGFVHKTGAWYITKEDATGGYRYTKGATGFSTGWTGRAGLTYDYFDAIF